MPTVNEMLAALNVDELSPLEALTKLHELKRMAAAEMRAASIAVSVKMAADALGENTPRITVGEYLKMTAAEQREMFERVLPNRDPEYIGILREILAEMYRR